MRTPTTALLALVLASVGGCAEQDARPAADAPPARDAPNAEAPAIEGALYPAELVMDHQAALALDAAQTETIRASLQETQRELVDAEWELRREREALAALLAQARIDEAAALAGADRVIEREGTIKRLHLRLLVRIKNQLTASQRAALDRLRER